MRLDAVNANITISRLSRESGLRREAIKTLVKTYGIPHTELGNRTIVHPEGVGYLREIIARYPGVNPSFAESAD
jgi:hypothetical protein